MNKVCLRNYLFQLTSYREREKIERETFCESEKQLRVAPSVSHYCIHYSTVFSIMKRKKSNKNGHSPRRSVILKDKLVNWRTWCSAQQYYRIIKSLWERTTLFPNINHSNDASNDTSNFYLSTLTHNEKREY